MQETYPNAIILSSPVDASSIRDVRKVSAATLELSENEAICNSDLSKNDEIVNDDESETINDDESEMPQMVPDVGNNNDDPKSGMQFTCLDELTAYYKQYTKRCGFGVMIRKSEK